MSKICNDCGSFFSKSVSPIRCYKCVKRKRNGGKLITQDRSVLIKVVNVGRELRHNGSWWKKDNCDHIKHVS